MSFYTSPAIIFRVVKYGETSVICDAYTREKGLRSFIASGVRSAKKSAQGALYRPLSIIEMTAADTDSDKLSRVKEIRLLYPYQHIASHVLHASVALFLIEVARNAIKERETNTELFDFLYEWLLSLDQEEAPNANLPNLFLIELAHMLGFGPLNNFSKEMAYFHLSEGVFTTFPSGADNTLDSEVSAALAALLPLKKNTASQWQMSRQVRNDLTDGLLRYYAMHVAGFRPLQSIHVLREMLHS